MTSKAQFLECCSEFVWINVLYRTILLMRLVYNKKGVLGTPLLSLYKYQMLGSEIDLQASLLHSPYAFVV